MPKGEKSQIYTKDYPGLSEWAQCNQNSHVGRRKEDQSQGESMRGQKQRSERR